MTKSELEIAKQIADIECVKAVAIFEGTESLESLIYQNDDGKYVGYNPFEWSILGPLMVKYKVELDFYCMYVQIYNGSNNYPVVDFELQKDIPRAILECVIKANEE